MPLQHAAKVRSIDPRSPGSFGNTPVCEALTGRMPFEGPYTQRLVQMVSAEAPDVRSLRREVPSAVAALVAKAVAREAARRFASADEMAEAIAALAEFPACLGLLRGLPPPVPRPAPRRNARAAFVSPLRAAAGDMVLEGRVEDIAVGGMMAFLPGHLTVGTRVALRFSSPTDGRVMHVTGLIRWTRQAERTGRFSIAAGIEFLDLSSDAEREIARYVHAVCNASAK